MDSEDELDMRPQLLLPMNKLSSTTKAQTLNSVEEAAAAATTMAALKKRSISGGSSSSGIGVGAGDGGDGSPN